MSEDTSGATPAAGASPTTSAASSAATPSSVPGPTTDPAGVRASLSYMTPEEERKWSGKGAPPPTGTSSAPPEGAHKVADYRVTSLAPSMEKTGGHPVPYNIWAKADDDLLYSPNVNYRGTPAMRLSSRISTNYGDEAADPAGGVASNAKQGMAAPITSSSIVRINGSWAIRHGDRFEMDKASVEGPANTIGEGRLTRDTRPRAAPKDERSWWRQATDAVGQWVAEHPRTMGAVQAVGGVGEAIGSAALITGGTAADATGAGAVVGVPAQALGWAGLVNSADNISTGLRQLWYGAPQQTVGQQAAGAAARALGASPEMVQGVEHAAGMGQAVLGGVAGMGGAISRTGRAVSKVEQAAEVGEKGVRVTRPRQIHHFATNKNRKFTPDMEEIAKKYRLNLDGDWNKEGLEHLGRHPDDYHRFVLDGMREADDIAQGNQSVFLQQFEQLVKEPVRQNPDLLRKSGW